MAIDRGWAINIGGGFHHCCGDRGGGFCAYADITLAIKFLFDRVPSVNRAMIVDLDAHQLASLILMGAYPGCLVYKITIFKMFVLFVLIIASAKHSRSEAVQDAYFSLVAENQCANDIPYKKIKETTGKLKCGTNCLSLSHCVSFEFNKVSKECNLLEHIATEFNSSFGTFYYKRMYQSPPAAMVTPTAVALPTTMVTSSASDVAVTTNETGCAIDATFLSSVTGKMVIFSQRQAEIYGTSESNLFVGLPEDVIPIDEYLSNGADIIQTNAAFEYNSLLYLIVDDGNNVRCSQELGFCVRASCCHGDRLLGSHLCDQSPLAVCCLGSMDTTVNYCIQGQAVVTYSYIMGNSGLQWTNQSWESLESVFGSSVNGLHIHMACPVDLFSSFIDLYYDDFNNFVTIDLDRISSPEFWNFGIDVPEPFSACLVIELDSYYYTTRRGRRYRLIGSDYIHDSDKACYVP